MRVKLKGNIGKRDPLIRFAVTDAHVVGSTHDFREADGLALVDRGLAEIIEQPKPEPIPEAEAVDTEEPKKRTPRKRKTYDKEN